MVAHPVWHPNPDAIYFNTQGINHLRGTGGKKPSVLDAERCFRKASEMGDNSAAYNLALLISGGYVPGSKSEIKRLIDPLLKLGLLSKLEYDAILGDNSNSDSDEPPEKYVDLITKHSNSDIFEPFLLPGYFTCWRSQLERNLRKILVNNNCPIKKGTLECLLRSAQLNEDLSNNLDDFRKCANKIIHHNKIRLKLEELSVEKVSSWEESICSIQGYF